MPCLQYVYTTSPKTSILYCCHEVSSLVGYHPCCCSLYIQEQERGVEEITLHRQAAAPSTHLRIGGIISRHDCGTSHVFQRYVAADGLVILFAVRLCVREWAEGGLAGSAVLPTDDAVVYPRPLFVYRKKKAGGKHEKLTVPSGNFTLLLLCLSKFPPLLPSLAPPPSNIIFM